VISVIGLGFVGLATALSFAEKGSRVTGFDIDVDRMATLRAGQLPFYEPGLDTALARHLGRGFVLADSTAAALHSAEIVFVCVGTRANCEGAADVSHVLGAIESALGARASRSFLLLVIKSTVPPGTTAGRIAPFISKLGWQVGSEVGLANNPEFLREGNAWEDVVHPDRIVIGVEDDRSRSALEELYASFDVPVHAVSWTTGEFVKYLSNSLLATMISFANDAAMLADAVGDIDVKTAFRILHEDRRWSGDPANMASYVYPGCGFGGYCLPKDTAALNAQARACGYESPVLAATLAVNRRICDHVVNHVLRQTKPGKPVGILGLAFKPGSDDVRETPARAIVLGLVEAGLRVLAYDPLAASNFRRYHGNAIEGAANLDYAEDLAQVAAAADPLVILTGWPEFREQRHLFAGRTVLDFRYML
jgi:UDPglucose 6-dehydrogenase